MFPHHKEITILPGLWEQKTPGWCVRLHGPEWGISLESDQGLGIRMPPSSG